MLNKIKTCIQEVIDSDEPFSVFYNEYIKRVQDQNIDMEVKNMLRFSIFQLSQLDRQIDVDYRKLVNEQHAKLSRP